MRVPLPKRAAILAVAPQIQCPRRREASRPPALARATMRGSRHWLIPVHRLRRGAGSRQPQRGRCAATGAMVHGVGSWRRTLRSGRRARGVRSRTFIQFARWRNRSAGDAVRQPRGPCSTGARNAGIDGRVLLTAAFTVDGRPATVGGGGQALQLPPSRQPRGLERMRVMGTGCDPRGATAPGRPARLPSRERSRAPGAETGLGSGWAALGSRSPIALQLVRRAGPKPGARSSADDRVVRGSVITLWSAGDPGRRRSQDPPRRARPRLTG